mgnify:CR=1 FL=1
MKVKYVTVCVEFVRDTWCSRNLLTIVVIKRIHCGWGRNTKGKGSGEDMRKANSNIVNEGGAKLQIIIDLETWLKQNMHR